MIHQRWVHVGRDADGEVYDPLLGPCSTCLRYYRRSEFVETPDGWTHEGCWRR